MKLIYVSDKLSLYYLKLFKDKKDIQIKYVLEYVRFKNNKIITRDPDCLPLMNILSMNAVRNLLEKLSSRTLGSEEEYVLDTEDGRMDASEANSGRVKKGKVERNRGHS